jgi:protein TonB
MEHFNDQLNWNDGSFHNETTTVGSALERLSRSRPSDDRSLKGKQQARMTSPTDATPPPAPVSTSPQRPPQPPAARSAHDETTIRADDAPHSPNGLFLFEQRKKRFTGALGVSVGVHALAIVLVLLLIAYAPAQLTVATQPDKLPDNIIWLDQRGPGGGGGGGGNQMKEPPRKAELPGKEKLTIPVVKTPQLTPPKKEPEKPPEVQQLNIPVKTESAGNMPLPGTLVNNQAQLTLSQGAGTGGGAGTGQGQGMGEGTGAGLGPGIGGGTGGGFYQPGNGVMSPDVLFEKKPNYTPDAMRARIQGTAWVAAVVLADGTVGEAHIVRSLDSAFGLDEEAIKAVKQWRFRPGTRFGKPVPVQVVIEVSFTMR